MITFEEVQKEQNRKQKRINKINLTKIKRIHEIKETLNTPHIIFDEATLRQELKEHSKTITTDTILTFIETRCDRVVNIIKIRYRHFIERGFRIDSDNRVSFFYIAIFKNLKTGCIHLKFGKTGKPRCEERYLKKGSETWQYIGMMCAPRSGPENEISALEKEVKKYCERNNLLQDNVQNFIYGGKSEVLKADISFKHIAEICKIVENRGFDSLPMINNSF